MISVIIPTYQEGKRIRSLVKLATDLALDKDFEVLVVDSTKEDDPLRVEAGSGYQVFRSAKGRAKQMNVGASKAGGSILLFLHADTRLPHQWDFLVKQAIDDHDYGGFLKTFDVNSVVLFVNAMVTNVLAIVFKQLMGDNCMFVRKDIFTAVGGFTDMPLMEDVDLSKKLRKYRGFIVREKVVTSARRFMDQGIVRTWLRMAYIRFLYMAGVAPAKLATWYEEMQE